MLLTALRLLHVCSATVAMLSGFMAMAFRKGSGLHGAAGSVFSVSLLSAPAPEEHRSSNQRAGINATAEAIACLP